MSIERITSVHNPRVKAVLALRDRKERMRSGLLRVEGFEELSLALESGALPRTLFHCAALIEQDDAAVLLQRARAGGAELVEVDERVFDKLSYRENPDGWLATFVSVERALGDVPLGKPPFVVVAEGVEKPGNLGAILRTADAAGVDGVVAAQPATDWGNPNVVRASKGALFSVPIASASAGETIDWLRRHAIAIIAATPDAETLYTDADLGGPVAIAVGEEKHGLGAAMLEAAKARVAIPMVGRVNSLNVSIATALLVYEVVRQRARYGATLS